MSMLSPRSPSLRLRQYPTLLHSQWRHHTQYKSSSSVILSHTNIPAEDGNKTSKPLVILHGLFGSKRNWSSILKAFHRDMPNRPLYALDLRNHGNSPHVTPMTYTAMARDVEMFIQDKGLEEVSLLGHSMGGKVAMAYALSLKERNIAPGTLANLIIADIAPSIGSLSPEFIRYIKAMKDIEALPASVIKTRTDADHKLRAYEPDLSIRQFLLTNLQLPVQSRFAHDNHGTPEKAKFIFPLSILGSSITNLGSFPYEYNAIENSVPVTWEGPTLAIKGTKSPYINRKNIPALNAFFPNVQLEELDSGHWVHAEKPTEFRKLVVDFLSSR